MMKLCWEGKTEELEDKPVLMPLGAPQTSIEFDQDRTRAMARLWKLNTEKVGGVEKEEEEEGRRERYTYLLAYSMEQSPSWEANWFCS